MNEDTRTQEAIEADAWATRAAWAGNPVPTKSTSELVAQLEAKDAESARLRELVREVVDESPNEGGGSVIVGARWLREARAAASLGAKLAEVRKRAIHDFYTGTGKEATHWWVCSLCKPNAGTWRYDEPENHEPTCPLRKE